MPIETICQGCSRRLRVADEYAGRQARCPQCGKIYTIPSADGSPQATDSSSTGPATDTPSFDAPDDQWQMRSPDGTTYGPVSKSELDQWLREGRISEACHLRREQTQIWQPARDVYPNLGQQAERPLSSQKPDNPFADDTFSGAYAPPNAPTSTRYLTPHRGALILTLGILGWAICCVFAPFAWAMGHADLQAMRAGKMDPAGKGITQAGMILGMIQLILFVVGVGLSIVVAVVNS